MRETRPSGSEGGEAGTNRPSLPLFPCSNKGGTALAPLWDSPLSRASRCLMRTWMLSFPMSSLPSAEGGR